MKKSIVAIVLLVTGAVGHAGPLDYVCGMKRTQQEVNSCVALVVNGGTVRMKKNYERIAASSKIPYDQKSGIPANHEEWAANVDKKCNDNVCVYNFISKRNEEIEQFMRKFGVAPV
jgi:hypothetical protein